VQDKSREDLRELEGKCMQQIWHGFQEHLGTNPKKKFCEKLLKVAAKWEAILYGSVQVVQQKSGHENRGSL
jgi:hypothetical protein